MQIRRTLFKDIITSTQNVRAIAMAVYIKRTCAASAIPNWSYNKLHNITGLHASTCRSYLQTLKDMGLVSFTGKNNNTIVFNSLASHSKRRNINLDVVVADSVKSIAYSLYSLLVALIQRSKDYVQQTIATIKSASASISDRKAAIRTARRCGWRDTCAQRWITEAATKEEREQRILDANRRDLLKYKDNGISLKGIGKRIKAGLQKVQRIIKFATVHDFLIKHTKRLRFFNDNAPIVHMFNPNKYTFATRNFLFIVKANRYSMGGRLSQWAGME